MTVTRFSYFVPAYITKEHQALLRENIRVERNRIKHHSDRLDYMEKTLNEAVAFSMKIRALRKLKNVPQTF